MANDREITIDLIKLFKFILKHIWLPFLLAVIGCGFMYWKTAYRTPKTYTASGTFYVYNGNPNLVNYQYTSTTDLDSAVQLIDTYMIVVRSYKVLDVIVERLSKDYPGIQPSFVSGSLAMASVSQTGVVRVSAITGDAQLSADICNAVLDVAPEEIIRVVGAGSIEIIDYAMPPDYPDVKNPRMRGFLGGVMGGLAGCILLFLAYMMLRRVTETEDLTDHFTPPVLSAIPRKKGKKQGADSYLISRTSPMSITESYARLRMNLFYTMAGKESHAVIVTSAIPGEGKSTIAANLARSCAMAGKKVLLVDGDFRRASQRQIFGYKEHLRGLSEALIGAASWKKAVIKDQEETLDLLPAGHLPPNPTELLESDAMLTILKEMEKEYDVVLLDMPPVNLVTDPLVLSMHVAGSLFVVRQDFSSITDIKDSLNAAEMTGMNVLGFVFYGEKVVQGSYYRRRYQRKYYSMYDFGNHPDTLKIEKGKK